MNAERLLTLYDRVADAPNAVERLRRFVLDLAVHGKLVEQDPRDEPVSELLKRIAEEKVRLARKGRFPEPRRAVEIGRQELPFNSPDHWGWVRLIEIAKIRYGFAFKSSQFNTKKLGMPLIRIRDISKTDAEAYFEGDYDSTYIVRAGDYLVGMDGNFNLRRWKGEDGLLNQRVMRINGWRCQVNPEFVRVPLQMVLNYLHGGTSLTTVKHLSAKQVNGIEIPLPPLAEQRRIVAKVGELMVLCDRLEETRTAREDTRDRLTKASLARLTAPNTDAAAFRGHARFALHALPALTARPDQVKHLRQTILSLAVRGKLVDQDPSDEPAVELLERTEELPVPARYAKRSPELIPGDCGLSINNPELPTPSGWSWVPLVRVARLESGHTPSRSRADWWGGDVPWMGLVDARAHNNGRIFDTNQYTNEAGLANSAARLLPEGTVCFSRTASVGYVVIMGRSMATSQDFVNWVPTKAVAPEWLQLVMMAERPALHRFSKGAVHQTIYYPAWLAMHVVLPPLAEQHRIVAKVDALMALCDQLEAEVGDADGIRSRLLDSLLHESLASQEASINGTVGGSARVWA